MVLYKTERLTIINVVLISVIVGHKPKF